MTDQLVIRHMYRPEVDELTSWAAQEGWNPGLHDADVFWATDPDAFIAAELEEKLIGGGAITSYDDEFGFMGFFIIRPEFRGLGFGNTLWHARRERLLTRLHPGASIGMDGVFAMQQYYAKGGFVFSHRDIRYCTQVPDHPDIPTVGDGEEIIPLTEVAFDQVVEYDRTCFPAPRPIFLRGWISQPETLALGYRRQGRLSGYGVVRRCREGCRIGPLFANDVLAAMTLHAHLTGFAAGSLLFLDVPENNPTAIELVRHHRMAKVFGCARMYLGSPPDLAHHRIFGVTTFDLG